LGKAATNGINMLDIFPANPFHVAIYLSSLVQTSRTVSPVTTAFYSLPWAHTVIGKTSPTDSLIVKNVFECAKRRLVTPIEKKETSTPDMLLKLYNSVFKENNLMSQRIISSCLLAFAEFLRVSELLYIKRSDIIFESCYVSIFIPKSKTDIYRVGNTVVISRMDNNLYPVKKFRKVFIVGEYFAEFR